MKIIKNTLIPFKGYLAINLFGVLFVRKELYSKLKLRDVNHEQIHTEQMKELLYIGFYIIYLLEWLYRVLFTKDRFSHKAYKNISFEREAYNNQDNLDYIETRISYAQWKKPNISK